MMCDGRREREMWTVKKLTLQAGRVNRMETTLLSGLVKGLDRNTELREFERDEAQRGRPKAGRCGAGRQSMAHTIGSQEFMRMA